MEKDKVFEKQKADRAAASASASGSHSGRKDEPWLSEDLVVKVLNYFLAMLSLLEADAICKAKCLHTELAAAH